MSIIVFTSYVTKIGRVMRLVADKPQFRVALVVADYDGKGDRVLVCKWLQNGRTWTQPRLEKRSALEAIDRESIDGRLRRVVDSAIDSVRIAAGVVYYKGGSHKLGAIEVGT